MGINQSNETIMCTESMDDGVYYYAIFHEEPFVSGACRDVYRGILKCNEDMRDRARYNKSPVVVKMFKKRYAKDFGAWNADISASKTANKYAILFNSKEFINRTLSFSIPYVAKMDTKAKAVLLELMNIDEEKGMKDNRIGSNEYVSMEEYIHGEYIKFNSNNGYVNNVVNSSTISTFSHWTYHKSNGALLVCDIQGVVKDKNYRLCDPAIHSEKGGVYGLTDLGVLGQAKFFESHKCNDICKDWKKIELTRKLRQQMSELETDEHTTFLFQVSVDIKIEEEEQ
ncbi:hypothetical protein I4U23_000221 [Adineta vaga]|nr:hypothetical protein I4U23_000221 [Adineta vaga]